MRLALYNFIVQLFSFGKCYKQRMGYRNCKHEMHGDVLECGGPR